LSLLSRLFLLAAVALVPAIAIQAYNEFCIRREREVEVHEQALSIAKLAAAEQQQIIQGIREVLVAMAELPAIKKKDSQACNAYLVAIRRRFPAFISFLVTDLDGWSFCSTYADNIVVSVGHRAYFANVLTTGAFTVGEFSTGQASGRKLIPFALPFYGDDGRMGGVIVAALSLDWLAQSIARKGVPPGAALAIVDRNGTYLARYPDNDRFMGRTMPRAGDGTANPQDTADTVDLDGVHRIVGYAALPIEAGGLVVSFGFNEARAFAEIWEHTRRGILLIILSTSLVLVLMWSGARRFVHRPLGQLVDAANRWRLGDYACRLDIGEGKSEVARVGAAFNIMETGLVQEFDQRVHDVPPFLNCDDDRADRSRCAAKTSDMYELQIVSRRDRPRLSHFQFETTDPSATRRATSLQRITKLKIGRRCGPCCVFAEIAQFGGWVWTSDDERYRPMPGAMIT
jgi:hypothetical protein